MRIVNSSTFASEIRISPAITSPLSRTRSRISTRLVVPETVGTLCMLSQETTEKIALGVEIKRDPCHAEYLSPSTTVNLLHPQCGRLSSLLIGEDRQWQ